MKFDTDHIDKPLLARELEQAYGVSVSALSFVPKGEDAYAYEVRSPVGRYFVRCQPVERAAGLAERYAALFSLRHEHGVTQVLAPLRTTDGHLTFQLAGYSVALFPFVEGSSLFEERATPRAIVESVSILAALHAADLDLAALPGETFENPFRAPIMEALALAEAQGASLTGYQQQVAELLLHERADLMRTFEHMERLRTRALALLRAPDEDAGLVARGWVPTHGDPNLANFLRDAQDGLHLTDWGELALGPAERDLVFFAGVHLETALRRYAELRPAARLHAELFEFYFYRWGLQEIADYAMRILFATPTPEEAAHAWEELQPYLPLGHESVAQGVDAVRETLARVWAGRPS